jgi:serine/threonine protein kinase
MAAIIAGVNHRDVKTANALLDGTHTVCKLADFGLSSSNIGDTQNVSFCGTLRYMAPEITAKRLRLAKEPAEGSLGMGSGDKADVFSFGMLVYEALHARRPFNQLTGSEASDAVVRMERPLIECAGLVPLTRLIQGCWMHRPEERPNMQEVLHDLERIVSLSAKPGSTNLKSASAWSESQSVSSVSFSRVSAGSAGDSRDTAKCTTMRPFEE